MGIVYKATNLINGKRYVGRTDDKLGVRWVSHAYNGRRRRGKNYFTQALAKYGIEMFRFSILKRCASTEELIAEETRLIQVLKPEYNTKRGGSGQRATKPWMPPELPNDWVLTGEEWRDVAGFEGHYQISNLGRVRSLPRRKKTKIGTLAATRGRILKQGHRNGQRAVYLTRRGKKTSINIHKLVAAAFIGPSPPGMGVLHRNDDHDDNGVGNLYFGTQTQNMKDRDLNGGTVRGEQVGRAKLTAEQVLHIVELRPSMTLHALAKRFGVSHTAVEAILGGASWRHVTGIQPIARFARKQEMSRAAT